MEPRHFGSSVCSEEQAPADSASTSMGWWIWSNRPRGKGAVASAADEHTNDCALGLVAPLRAWLMRQGTVVRHVPGVHGRRSDGSTHPLASSLELADVPDARLLRCRPARPGQNHTAIQQRARSEWLHALWATVRTFILALPDDHHVGVLRPLCLRRLWQRTRC